MRVCILGTGTASAVSLLTMISRTTQLTHKMLSIDVIHDPKIPSIQVGEATSTKLYEYLFRILCFDITEDIKEFNGTLKWSSKFFWKLANGNEFKVMVANPGLHIDSTLLSSYVMKEVSKIYPQFKIIEDNVINLEQNEFKVRVSCNNYVQTYDLVVDCRGMPSSEELKSNDYLKPANQFINSVILYPEFKSYKEEFTSSHVHKDGWMFGIPLQHRKTWGYLYNTNYTSEKNALKLFSKIKNIETTELRKFSWQQYYRKKAMENRILYLGNRLYFFDPSGAVPIFYYFRVMETVISEIQKNVPIQQINENVNKYHLNSIEKVQDFISYLYSGDNNIKSDFWITSKKIAVERLKNSKEFCSWAKNNSSFIIDPYWDIDAASMLQYQKGLKINMHQFFDDHIKSFTFQ